MKNLNQKQLDLGKKYQGWGLVETLLTLGTISALSIAVYMTFGPTDVSAKVKAEQTNMSSLAQNIQNSYGTLNNYSAVSNNTALQDNIFPKELIRENSAQSGWGSAIVVQPHTVNNPNDSFSINYQKVSKEICSKLTSAASNSTYDIVINGTSVISNGAYNTVAASQACQEQADIAFVFYPGHGSGIAVASDPLELAPPPASVTPDFDDPITDVVNDPIGVGDATPPAITPPAPGIPTPPAPPPVAPTPIAPAPVAPTPPNPTIPPPDINGGNRTPCSPFNENRNANNCPAGTYGFSNQQQTYSCPEAWGNPQPSGWQNVSTSCANCPAATNEQNIRWINVNESCPVGQSGGISYEKQQTQNRNVSYNCPSGTASLPSPTYGAWSGWNDTGITQNQTSTCAGGKCAVSVDYQSGTLDVSDAYYSISYTANGVSGGCSASWRNDGKNGAGSCNVGNGVLDRIEWQEKAVAGDRYSISGSQTGWEGSRGEFWGWELEIWEIKAGSDCP